MNVNYADAILKLRYKLNLSQQAMAKYLGVSFASISRWERGQYEPTKLVKLKIDELLNKYSIEMDV